MTTVASPVDAAPRIHVLGGFSVSVARRPVALPRNAQRLLGYLAVTGLEQPRDTVASQLWPQAVPDRAMSYLRTALWRVRQADRAIVRARRDSLSLCDPVEVDYDDLIARARHVLAGEVTGDGVLSLPLDLLEADLLPGWDEEWLLLDRERHRQLRIHALESLSETLTAKGQYARAIDAAYAAVRVEPLHESAHAALIAAHVAEGNRVEAVRQFQSYSLLLADEAGMTPSPRLAQLVGDLDDKER